MVTLNTQIEDGAMDQRQDLNWLRERARRGINQARRLRKYTPPGPYSPIERGALAALVDVERAAERLLLRETRV